MPKSEQSFTVGFFSAMEPGRAQVWRPKEKDAEECGEEEAGRRYAKLRRSMRKGKVVDGLSVASIWMKDEQTGDYIRCMTSDGTEATATLSDLLHIFTGTVVGSA